MAEPGQALVFTDFQRRVAQILGYDRTPGNWSSNQTAEVNDIIQSGYRQFLYPFVPGRGVYEWSFLRPTQTLVAWADTTGTTSGAPVYDAAAYSTVTATTSIFHPTMIGSDFTFDTSGTDYEIYSYTSGTVIKVVGDASGEASGDTCTITATGNLAMPDDFGGTLDHLWFDSDNSYNPLVCRSEGEILNLRSGGAGNGVPQMFAVRPKTTDGTVGQRFEMLVWPTPSTDYTLYYKYLTLRNELDGTYDYPLGGAQHAETVLLAILSEAEVFRDEAEGVYTQRFRRQLAASIAYDKEFGKATSLGYVGDNSDFIGTGNRDYRRTSYNSTYYP